MLVKKKNIFPTRRVDLVFRKSNFDRHIFVAYYRILSVDHGQQIIPKFSLNELLMGFSQAKFYLGIFFAITFTANHRIRHCLSRILTLIFALHHLETDALFARSKDSKRVAIGTLCIQIIIHVWPGTA